MVWAVSEQEKALIKQSITFIFQIIRKKSSIFCYSGQECMVLKHKICVELQIIQVNVNHRNFIHHKYSLKPNRFVVNDENVAKKEVLVNRILQQPNNKVWWCFINVIFIMNVAM